MPNIFKHFSRQKAELYQFPDAADLVVEPEREEVLPVEEEPLSVENSPQTELRSPIRYAQVQSDAIVQEANQQADEIAREANRQAEEILAQAREEGERIAEQIREAARAEGFQTGYAQGMAQAMEVSSQKLREDAAAQEAAVQQFLEKAAAALDRQMDENVEELRDLSLAVAEKVVCVSLKSSGEVISRMIQTAVDKRKRREWVRIYIAECDARRMAPIPPALTAALTALSDRVRIIPMVDEEPGTCIVEMPNEIIDASASTQLTNIRSLLSDTPSGGGGGNLF